MGLHSQVIAAAETVLNVRMSIRRALCRRGGHRKLANTFYVVDDANLHYCARCGEPYADRDDH
jgi:hypothetical protein